MDTPAQALLGLGDAIDAATLRRVAAGYARLVRRFGTVALRLPSPDSASAMAEGFLLGLYQFSKYKSTKYKSTKYESADASSGATVSRLDLIGAGTFGQAQARAAAITLARDLVNEPGGSLTPVEFARCAAEVAAARRLKCEVWDEHRIATERLGGLLGVARGSVQPPRLVRLAYQPAQPTGTVALVGKGVTFDSGGLSIKPGNMMADMKSDMAGAAAVLGAMSALAELDCPAAVVAWLPLTDNMPGGDATRLGDVLRIRNGRTVEIRNADAEGRLILADALALAAEETPDAIVDVATLTDTIPMMLGRKFAGLAGNHEGWIAQVRAAAERAGELVWPVPMHGVERKQLESKIGDLVNTPLNRYGQSALAALFLSEFVPPAIPWAHLDIAGPALCDEDDGEWTAGGTGFATRTLLELLLGIRTRSSLG